MGTKLNLDVVERLKNALEEKDADDALDPHTVFLLFISAHMLEGSTGSTKNLCAELFNLTASHTLDRLDSINQKTASQAQKMG